MERGGSERFRGGRGRAEVAVGGVGGAFVGAEVAVDGSGLAAVLGLSRMAASRRGSLGLTGMARGRGRLVAWEPLMVGAGGGLSVAKFWGWGRFVAWEPVVFLRA